MEIQFLQVTAYQLSSVEEKLEVGEMGQPNTLCFGSYNSRRRIQVIRVIARKPRPQWLSCGVFVTRSAKWDNCQKKLPKLPYQFVFQGQRTLQLRAVAGTTLPGAWVQQPLAPFQWHLIQKCQISSQPQGHQCSGR